MSHYTLSVLWHRITAAPHQRTLAVLLWLVLGDERPEARPRCVPSSPLPSPALPLPCLSSGLSSTEGTCTPAPNSPIPPPSLHHLSPSSHIHYRAGQHFHLDWKREGERKRGRRVKQREAEGAYDTKKREREREIRALEREGVGGCRYRWH